ncbi:MAG: hypothetical protein Q8N26_22830, partial [Myxococcales bacterium]|nr:hypothetical protein [Myxococcales bacterium]
AGGAAAGGAAAGGSAAGGSAAGGSAAGGSAAGGSAGGGSAAGTPNNIRGTVIDPEGIVAFGVLANNTCHGAYAAIDAGNRPSVGVPCNLNPTHAFLRPDGGFIYRHPTTGRVLAAVPDPMGSTSGGWLYPTLDAGVAANDLDLTPAPCTGATLRFLLRPDTGSVVAQCADGTWREGSTPLPALDGTDVIAFAVNGSALVGTDAGLQLISASGTVTPVSAPFGPISKMTRANAQGFLAVRFTPPCSLYQLTLSGTATKLGDYTTTTTLPGTVPVFCNGRIDASGTLFYGTTSIGGSQIIRRPLVPGSMSYAFGTNTMSTVWDFGPRFNLLLQDGNGMVAAP